MAAMYKKASAVIPAFNEAKTIEAIVRVVRGVRCVEEIIVVDDGSGDGTGNTAQRAGARVISLKENAGKGKAMIRGVEAAAHPVLLFLDADLLGLKQKHIQSLLDPVLAGEYDMVVGVIDRGEAMNDINRFFEAPFSGIRALKKDLWEAVPRELKSGYLVDSAISVSADKKNMRVLKITLQGVKNSPKTRKRGLFRGIVSWIRMWVEIAYKSVLFFTVK
ncbi:MAG: glycosyltransferase family 2 protein [Candidatus Wildermuthbacteria bacterium]|nr:glycosyltransferase family 2 protein [Candidatus Wildermuthbacteria bacterium]